MEIKQTVNSVKSWTFRIIFVALVLFLGGYLLLGSITYSEGFMIGTPTTFSKQGIIFKTFEGKINVNQSQNLIIDDVEKGIWSYSVRKNVEQEVLKKIEEAIQNNQRAKFYYRKKLIKSSFLGDTQYFVYDVEMLDTSGD
jgi:hypothetical protein